MKSLTEVKVAILKDPDFSPGDRVAIHIGYATDDREHMDGLDCWCKPLAMSGQEFLDTEFDL